MRAARVYQERLTAHDHAAKVSHGRGFRQTVPGVRRDVLLDGLRGVTDELFDVISGAVVAILAMQTHHGREVLLNEVGLPRGPQVLAHPLIVGECLPRGSSVPAHASTARPDPDTPPETWRDGKFDFTDHLIESVQGGTIEEIDDENDDED